MSRSRRGRRTNAKKLKLICAAMTTNSASSPSIDLKRRRTESPTDKEEDKHLSKRTKTWMEMLECPVCTELPRKGPIYGCRNGHHLCQGCVEKVNECPVCREPDLGCRNILAEKVVDVTLKDVPMKCKWPNCNLKLVMSTLGDHERLCHHREIPCPSFHRNACDWRGPLSGLIHHVRNVKCVQVLFDERRKNLSKEAYIEEDADDSIARQFKHTLGDFANNSLSVFSRPNVVTHWKPIVLLSKHLINYWIYLIVQRDQKGQWILMVYTMMPQSVAEKITVKITVTGPRCPERAYVFEGHPLSFETPKAKAMESGNYLLLIDNQVKPLKHAQQVFSYCVDIKMDPDFEAYRKRLTCGPFIKREEITVNNEEEEIQEVTAE